MVVSAVALLGSLGDVATAQSQPLSSAETSEASSKPTKVTRVTKPQKANKPIKKSRSGFPDLKMLPEGSYLKEVKIPRYDKDFNPISLLTAENVKVGDLSVIDAQNVYIELYHEDHSVKLKSRMKQAYFDQRNSTLRSTMSTTLEGSNFIAKGSSLTIHEASGQGFLVGPCFTKFTKPHKKASTAMNLKKVSQPIVTTTKKVVTGTLITATSGMLMAERPPSLTETETAQLDQQATTLSEQVSQAQQASTQELEEATAASQATQQEMTDFLQQTGQKAPLTIQTTTDQPTPANDSTKGAHSATNQEAFSHPSLPDQLGKDQETLTVECDGGLYFDAKQGVLVYLDNIRLNNKTFKMSCKDELKVYTEPKKESSDKKASPKKDSNNDKVKKIIATGQVVLSGKDAKGSPYLAHADEAHYDAKTETFILRGGYPSIQQSKSQYLKSKDKNGYIRIPKNGSIVTSKGAWENKFIIPKQ